MFKSYTTITLNSKSFPVISSSNPNDYTIKEWKQMVAHDLRSALDKLSDEKLAKWITQYKVQKIEEFKVDPLKIEKNPWDEDPDYPIEDWVSEVYSHDTRLGYQEWVEHQKEMDNA